MALPLSSKTFNFWVQQTQFPQYGVSIKHSTRFSLHATSTAVTTSTSVTSWFRSHFLKIKQSCLLEPQNSSPQTTTVSIHVSNTFCLLYLRRTSQPFSLFWQNNFNSNANGRATREPLCLSNKAGKCSYPFLIRDLSCASKVNFVPQYCYKCHLSSISGSNF